MLINSYLIVVWRIINLGHNPIAIWADFFRKCVKLAVYSYYLLSPAVESRQVTIDDDKSIDSI